jgi:UDP-N-acetylglucosamine 2-epimerase (non-hydrolysing)
MTDVCIRVRDAVAGQPAPLPESFAAHDSYLVSTVHRAENTDDPERLRGIVDALAGLPMPVLLLAHPRLVARCLEHDIDLDVGSIHSTKPLPYSEMISAVVHSAGVVTDSGGLQKEAYLLRRPCTTLRTETEWTETLGSGWNVLASDLTTLPELVMRAAPTAPPVALYGDGKAAERVLDTLVNHS